MLRQFRSGDPCRDRSSRLLGVSGAVAADEETGEVHLIKLGFEGPQRLATALPTGIRIVRRHKPKRLAGLNA